MTNTKLDKVTEFTEITFEEMAAMQLRNAEFRAVNVREAIEARVVLGDYGYLARHDLSSAVRLQHRISVLTILVRYGREALVPQLSSGLNEGGRSSDGYTNAAAEDVRRESLELLREFRSFLSADEALALVSRLH